MSRTYTTTTYDHNTRSWKQVTIVTAPACDKCDDYGVSAESEADCSWYCDCAAGDARRDDDAASYYYND